MYGIVRNATKKGHMLCLDSSRETHAWRSRGTQHFDNNVHFYYFYILLIYIQFINKQFVFELEYEKLIDHKKQVRI